jgi:hypothetical protein
MEYYDRSGNIKKINIQFEPLIVNKRREATHEHRPVASFSSCDDCLDNTCFYGRYRQYCSDNFIGKCDKAIAADERQRLLKIILT